MKAVEEKNKEKKERYINSIMKIAFPLILSNAISQVQMIIDRMFLGQVDPLYMSAIGNVNSPMWTSMSFCFAITAGASILISQNVGAGNMDKVKEYTSSMIKWNNLPCLIIFLCWLLFGEKIFALLGVSETLMPYCMAYLKYFMPIILLIGLEGSMSVIMQTSNYTMPLLVFGILRSGINIVLDYALIFGHFGLPALGIEGAAIATTIAEYLGLLSCLVFIRSEKLITRPSLKQTIHASAKPYLSSLGMGVNCAMEELAWNAGNLVIMRILNSINDLAAGIYGMVFSVEILVVVVVASFGTATMILTGEAKGKNDRDQYSQVVKSAYGLSALVAFVMLIICFINPERILSLFTKDTYIIETCGYLLILVCVNLFGKSANIICGSGIKGSGDTKWMLYTQVFGTVLVVTCAWIMVYVFKLGILGVFVAVMIDEGLRAIINFGKFGKVVKCWN